MKNIVIALISLFVFDVSAQVQFDVDSFNDFLTEERSKLSEVVCEEESPSCPAILAGKIKAYDRVIQMLKYSHVIFSFNLKRGVFLEEIVKHNTAVLMKQAEHRKGDYGERLIYSENPEDDAKYLYEIQFSEGLYYGYDSILVYFEKGNVEDQGPVEAE